MILSKELLEELRAKVRIRVELLPLKDNRLVDDCINSIVELVIAILKRG